MTFNLTTSSTLLTHFFFNHLIIRTPSSNADEYKGQAVELIGWGAKVRSGAVSSQLKRVTLSVITMRYSITFSVFKQTS
jgi:hypothetical protein